jgi:hypothetical protein
MEANSTLTAALAVCCSCMTCVSQAVVARIAGKPGIIQAAKSGDIALVQDHLFANASCVNDTDFAYGRTPLHWSAATGNVDISRLLISSKADVDARNKECDSEHA